MLRAFHATVGAAALALLLGIGSTTSAATERVGVNSAVNPHATGTPPNAVAHRLVIGGNVLYQEHIATGHGGQTQILFVDQSTMSVGPNSNLVIDQFVYNPHTGGGKMVANLAHGIFRYVGGQLSKHDNAVQMTTPSATIGIRGGIILVRVTGNNRLAVIFVFGKGVTITGLNGVSQTITRPGFEVTVASPGASPSDPFEAPSALIESFLAALDGRPGGTGGATVVPTDSMVVGSGIPTINSQNFRLSLQSAFAAELAQPPRGKLRRITSAPIWPPQPPGQLDSPENEPPEVNIINLPTQTDTQIASSQSQSLTPPPPVTVTPPPPVTVTYAGAFNSTTNTGSGFLGGSTPYSVGTLTYPAGMPQNGVFAVAFPTAGLLSIPLVPGSATINPINTTSPLGPVGGTSFMNSDRSFFYANLTPTQQPSAREFIFGGQPVASSFFAPQSTGQFSAFNVQPDAALQSPIPFITNAIGGSISNPSVSPLYLAVPANVSFGATAPYPHWLQGSLAIAGQGANQTSVLVINTGSFTFDSATGTVVGSGLIRGSFLSNGGALPLSIEASSPTVLDGNNNALFGAGTIAGFVLGENAATQSTLDGSSTDYGFLQPAVITTTPSVIGSSRTTRLISGYFGGLLYSNPASSYPGSPYPIVGATEISTDATTGRLEATFGGSAFCDCSIPIILNFGSLIGSNSASSTFVDDNTFAAVESPNAGSSIGGNTAQSVKLGLVSSGVVPNNPLLPNGLCQQCQYLTWGYWTADVTSSAIGGGTEIDRAHIGFWTAGIPSVTMPATGTASYAGNAIGSVYEAGTGSSYLASGKFDLTYDFGLVGSVTPPPGSVSISNFAGQSFSGAVYGSGGSYSGSLSSSNQTIFGEVNGAFYGPNAAETAGYFAVQAFQGTPFQATGIFAGHR